ALHAEQCRAGTDADAAARPRARHRDRYGAGNAPLLLGGIAVAQRRGDRAWRDAAWIPGLDPPRHLALRRRHPGRLGGAPPAKSVAPPAIRLRRPSRQQQAVDDVAEDCEHSLRIRAIEYGGVLGAEHRPPRNRASGVPGEVDRDQAPSCTEVGIRDDLLLSHGSRLPASGAPAAWPGNWPHRPPRWPARHAQPYIRCSGRVRAPRSRSITCGAARIGARFRASRASLNSGHRPKLWLTSSERRRAIDLAPPLRGEPDNATLQIRRRVRARPARRARSL